MKYHIKGEIEVTYHWIVDQEIEATDEDDAIEAVCEDLDPHESYFSDTDTYSLEVNPIDLDSEPTEAQRMLALGMPMLPGF